MEVTLVRDGDSGPNFGDLYVEIPELYGDQQFLLADVAPTLAAKIEAIGGYDELTKESWEALFREDADIQSLIDKALYEGTDTASEDADATRLEETVKRRDILSGDRSETAKEFLQRTTEYTGSEKTPWFWTPEVIRHLNGSPSWLQYLIDEVKEPRGSGDPSIREQRSFLLQEAISTHAGYQPPEGEDPTGMHPSPAAALDQAKEYGYPDAVVFRRGDLFGWEIPDRTIDPDGTYPSQQAAIADATAQGFPDAIVTRDRLTGRWGWVEKPEPKPQARRSLQQVIEDAILAGDNTKAIALDRVRDRIEQGPIDVLEALEAASKISANADEAVELFNLMTRREDTAELIAPLGLEDIAGGLRRITAARAGVLGGSLTGLFPPEIPWADFPQPGEDEFGFEGAPSGAQLFPDQPEVAAAFDAETAGPSARELALRRLGIDQETLAGLNAESLAVLTSRRDYDPSDREIGVRGGERRPGEPRAPKPIFIEDLLGVDEITPEMVAGLTPELFAEATSKLDAEGNWISTLRPGASKTILGELFQAADWYGPRPTESDLSRLHSQRTEETAARKQAEREKAETEAETKRKEATAKLVTEGRSFTGRKLFA